MTYRVVRWLAAIAAGSMMFQTAGCDFATVGRNLTSVVLQDVLFFVLDTTFVELFT